MDLLKRIQEQIKREQREEEIHCPYCDALNTDEEYDHVSYWGHGGGEEGRKTYCNECDREFFVREQVRRTYETFKLEEDRFGL